MTFRHHRWRLVAISLCLLGWAICFAALATLSPSVPLLRIEGLSDEAAWATVRWDFGGGFSDVEAKRVALFDERPGIARMHHVVLSTNGAKNPASYAAEAGILEIRIRRDGAWERLDWGKVSSAGQVLEKEAARGLLGSGGSLSFSTELEAVEIIAIRHPWSGILTITVDGKPQIEDLFDAKGKQDRILVLTDVAAGPYSKLFPFPGDPVKAVQLTVDQGARMNARAVSIVEMDAGRPLKPGTPPVFRQVSSTAVDGELSLVLGTGRTPSFLAMSKPLLGYQIGAMVLLVMAFGLAVSTRSSSLPTQAALDRGPGPRVAMSFLKNKIGAALFLGALAATAYAPTLNVFFLADDFDTIAYVARPDGGTNWSNVRHDFHGTLFGWPLALYRPLFTLGYGIDYSLFGLDHRGYHLTNIVSHAISSFLVYLIALELVPSERRKETSLAAAALFAVHPIHPEVVTWLPGRLDALSALLYLPALICFLRWLRTERTAWITLSVALYALSLLSKESAAALPGLLFLCAIYARKAVTVAIASMVPFAAVLGFYFAFRYVFLDVSSYQAAFPAWDVYNILSGLSYWTLHLFFSLNLGILPGLWPWIQANGFSVWYMYYPVASLGHWVEVLSLTFILGCVCLARFYGKANLRLLMLLLGLYGVSLAPVLRLLYWNPLLLSSRWFYIPSAFLSIFFAYVVWAAVARLKSDSVLAPWAMIGLIIAVYFAALVANNEVWLRAGALAQGHVASGTKPQIPLYYKGAYVFPYEYKWDAANNLPFKDRSR